MKRSTVLLVALMVVVLMSCAKQPIGISPGVSSAAAGIAGMDADLDSIYANSNAAKPHADPVGQAYLGSVQTSTTDAKGKVGPINAALDAASAQIGTFNGQITTLKNQITDLKNDTASVAHKLLGACIVFGVLILTGGIISIPYTGPLGRYIIIGGLVMAVASASLSLAVSAIAIILPWFLGALAVIVVVVIAVELIVNRKALFSEQTAHAATTAALTTAHAAVAEVVADTATSVQPTVPYTPATQAIVQQVAGIVAAAPVVSSNSPVTMAPAQQRYKPTLILADKPHAAV